MRCRLPNGAICSRTRGWVRHARLFYEVRGELERLLATSFPAPDDIPLIRQMFEDSLADDGLGMKTKRKEDKILLSYPIAILAADV